MTKHEILKLSTLELYDKILEFFDIRELISPGVYQKYAHTVITSFYQGLTKDF